jgi:hypothetical protein
LVGGPSGSFQPVEHSRDPKSVLCAFFKAGSCDKGTKCKFSHDLNVERKVEKKSLYSDEREEKQDGLTPFPFARNILMFLSLDTMDKWDEEKLRSVVLSKAGNPRTTTDVCLHSEHDLVFTTGFRSYANTLLRLWNLANMGGFGNVLMVGPSRPTTSGFD